MPSSVPIPTIAWCSNIFIDFLQRTPGSYEHIRPVWDQALARNIKIIGSTLAISEIIRVGQAPSAADDALIADFFMQEELVLRAADRVVCQIARDIKREHKIETADAIHIATAIHERSLVLLTLDENKRNGRTPPLDLHEKVGVPPLKIMRPKDWNAQQFAASNPLFPTGP